ncbi:MAG TPA: Rad52/Rad22 family DNA repair protein, partial [Pyrinomonadaceae bacterium]|nr:Rad52/Rad22 family DNA repair protein [Pyrinomonadaceae bacterium]
MTTKVAVKQTTEMREKRAQAIAAMGLVQREGDRFRVSQPGLRNRQKSYEVWRDDKGKVCCSCLEFEEQSAENAAFRCEHILAVKFSLLAKNSEPMANQPAPHVPVMPEAIADEQGINEEKNASEARQATATEVGGEAGDGTGAGAESRRAEQEQNEVAVVASTVGQTEAREAIANRQAQIRQFADTKGKINMKKENTKAVPFAETENQESNDNQSNVIAMPFTQTLQALRQNVDPNLVKQREGWRDRNGNVHTVDYVEWHTVADILDRVAPHWSHTIRDIKQIGDSIAVTAAITVDGVTREGIGTGAADTEMGIKKAEHDALKRAAVKFGIARELYRRESEVIEREGTSSQGGNGGFPQNPVARSLADLVTP